AKEQHKEAVVKAKSDAADFFVDTGLNIASDMWQIEKFGMITSYGQWGAKIGEWAFKNLDAESWSEKACSLKVQRKDDVANEGSIIQCEEGLCKPVLTMAGERFKLDNSTAEQFGSDYVYSVVFHTGHLQPPVGDVSPELSFKLYLSGEKDSYFENAEGGEWISFGYTELYRFEESIKSNVTYDELCVKFERGFPPGRFNSDKLFCRSLVSSSTGSSAFDTGSVAPQDYMDPETYEGENPATDYQFRE
ncbi:MAG: hypothetical protein ACQESC_02195, partial [Nanobdellota archaeon]